MKNFLAPSVFHAFWISLALLWPVLGVTLARSVFSADPAGEALLRGAALALPAALAGAMVVAKVADTFSGHGGRTWIAAGLTLLILGVTFVLLRDWILSGGADVRSAAAAAIDEDGFYLTRQLFASYGAWALLLFPVLILALLLDSVVLVFIPLFHLPFWVALALFLLRMLGWLALGGGLGTALGAGLLRLQKPSGGK